jgi:predicted RNase H-like nuclease (RuvC/YqgF family)
MADDSVNDIRELKVSKITLGFIASILFVGGTVAWTAAGTANRISNLEDTVHEIESNKSVADQAVMSRLESLERTIENMEPPDTTGLESTVKDMEDAIEELERRLEEDIQWQIGDLWWRTDMIEDACRTKKWCDEILSKEFDR